MVRTWLRRITWLLLGVAVLVAAMPLATILPLVRDDLTLDRIVVAVALDWRDFGVEKAGQRLQYELDHRGIGSQVDEGDCSLRVDDEERREVSCAWEMRVDLPFLEAELPLSFSSSARIDRHGVLLR